MNLDFLFNYKNKLMEDIITDEKIVNLINDSVKTEEEAHDLIYNQVFPHGFIPETLGHAKTCIYFDIDIQRTFNSTYLQPRLYIWVLVHNSAVRLPGGGVRYDAICSAISQRINGSKEYGLGEINLSAVTRYSPTMDFSGKVMTFDATDFNRVYDPKKKVPSNRKRW